MNTNIKQNKKLIKIAKRLIAENTYDSIGQEALDHFENFFKSILDERFSINSHDGSSYDGFMSFTQGYVEGVASLDGWETFQICDSKKQEEIMENIQNSFYYDFKEELFQDKSEEEAMKMIQQAIKNQNDQIWSEYEDYEPYWMSDKNGSAFVAIQFYANGKAYQTEDWTCSIYSGYGDSYGRRQEYIYEDSVDFKDINEPGIIQKIESKIKEAYNKLDIDF